VRGEVFAAFASPDSVLAAAERLHALGYTRVQAYTPYSMPELEETLRVPRTKIPIGVFAAGMTGVITAYLIIWFTNAVNYPLDVGGRPLNSLPADVPIIFETMVLFAGITSFVLALVANRLPRLHDALSEVAVLERTSVDRFVLRVSAADPRFDERIFTTFEESGAVDVVRVGMVP
jgi:hypothetical protein